MRQIGQLDNELDARTFQDYLYNQRIGCDIEPGRDGAWLVWVHDEDRLAEVAAWFGRFKVHPGDAEFVRGAEGADKKRVVEEKEERKLAQAARRSAVGAGWQAVGAGPATWVLVAVSVVVTLLIQFGQNDAMFRVLMISEYPFAPSMKLVLPEVVTGQVWRLITPVFMHLGILHLVFNMLWLRDLGGMVEHFRGARFLVVFVLLTGILSNVGQYAVSGPAFGGMSGVVYGLLGYVWLQSRLNPWSGFVMHSYTVNMMLVWLVLGVSGAIGPVANITHAAGLVIGVAWGYLDARRGTRG